MTNFVVFSADERGRYVPRNKGNVKPMRFPPGMQVRYTGETLNKRCPEDMKSKIGEVIAKVQGDTDALVIEFGNKSFVVNPVNLVEYVPKEKNTGPEITHILRKWQVDEDESK